MFDFREFLEVSKQIESTDKLEQESFRRTAVSRAYYCVYNVTREYVEAKSMLESGALKGEGGHKFFWMACNRISNISRLNISEDGARLLQLRKKADYESREKVSKFNVKNSIKTADRIIKKIDEKK